CSYWVESGDHHSTTLYYLYTYPFAGYDRTIQDRIGYMLEHENEFRARFDDLLVGNSIEIEIDEGMSYHTLVVFPSLYDTADDAQCSANVDAAIVDIDLLCWILDQRAGCFLWLNFLHLLTGIQLLSTSTSDTPEDSDSAISPEDNQTAASKAPNYSAIRTPIRIKACIPN